MCATVLNICDIYRLYWIFEAFTGMLGVWDIDYNDRQLYMIMNDNGFRGFIESLIEC